MAHGKPILLGASGSVEVQATKVCRFICKTTGTLTITDANGDTAIDAFPVTAGEVYELEMYLQGRSGTISLTTAAGTVTIA